MSAQIAHRILVIDDDASVGQEICDALALRNLSGLYAPNIMEARKELVRDSKFGVVIVDYHMPEMTGIEVIEHLRKEHPQKLAFIVLTGDDTQSTAIQAVRAQAFDFLQKPFTGPAVADSVRRASEHLVQLEEADRRTETLRAEGERLRARVESVTKMLHDQQSLLGKLVLADHSELLRAHMLDLPVGVGDVRSAAEQSVDFAPLECAAVDVPDLLRRMLPALEGLSNARGIQLKARVPGKLPFLYGDEKRLARAIADVAGTLMKAMLRNDRLTMVAVKEGTEVVLTFRAHSAALDGNLWRVLTADLTAMVDEVDKLDVSEMNMLGARLVVHLHGGRLVLAEERPHEWALRAFFPLSSGDTTH